MKLKSVKKNSEIVLAGIAAELDLVDSSVQGLTLRDAAGNMVRIALRSYSMQVEVPAPPVMEKKFRLSGEVLGLPVERTFDSQYEADDERQRLESGVRGEEAALKVEEVEVAIAE
jgi:hypothetical protein